MKYAEFLAAYKAIPGKAEKRTYLRTLLAPHAVATNFDLTGASRKAMLGEVETIASADALVQGCEDINDAVLSLA